MRCTHCGGTSFDEDRARADLVCLDCGIVLSENAISSEVEFVETNAGVSTAVGRFVSDESQVVGRESRQVTESKARKRIDTICGHLRLGNDISLSAFRYYQSALFRGLTRGRGALQVAAGCIYLAARQLRVNLMLLDLSDAVGINVYVLGHCYSELRKRLHLSMPEMDPCLYIERFASQLEFGDKMPMVATTAMRLLQRMKKDWLATGRRPSGLAAAALLVAARIHEFNRNEEDVARIARISQQTARKRLEEFSRTPTSALSIEDFFTVDYEEEQDPPAFTAARKSDEAMKELDETSFAKISAEISELEQRIDTELDVLSQKRSCRLFRVKLDETDFGRSKGIQHLLNDTDASSSGKDVSEHEDSVILEDQSASSVTNSDCVALEGDHDDKARPRPGRNILREVLDGLVEPTLLDSCVEDLQILTEHKGDRMCELLGNAEEARNAVETAQDAGEAYSGELKTAPMRLPVERGVEMKPAKLPAFISSVVQTKKEFPSNDDGSLALDGIDDSELDQEYLLHPREMMIKAAIWYKANADYLQTARRKRLAKRQQLEYDSKHPSKKRAKRQTGQRRARTVNPYANRDKFEPIDEESEDKPISRKINYEALEALVGTSSSNTTTVAGPSTGPPKPGPLLASTLTLGLSSPATVQASSVPVTPIEGTTDHLSTKPSKVYTETEREGDEELNSVRQSANAAPQRISNSKLGDAVKQPEAETEEEEDEPLMDEDEVEDAPLDDFYHDDEDDIAWQQGDELW